MTTNLKFLGRYARWTGLAGTLKTAVNVPHTAYWAAAVGLVGN